jgi:retinol dehydrogenase-16
MDLLIFIGYLVTILCCLKLVEFFMRRIFLPYSKYRCVLVTGCDTGFGHCLAQELDKKGVRVFASCLTEEGVRNLTEKCSSNAVVFRLDVTSDDSIQNAVTVVKSKLSSDEGG